MILDNMLHNDEYKIYQKKIFLEGWKYFDDDTKIKIKDLYAYKDSDYYIEDEKLKFKANRIPKKVQSLPPKPVPMQIPEIDINEDEIPF